MQNRQHGGQAQNYVPNPFTFGQLPLIDIDTPQTGTDTSAHQRHGQNGPESGSPDQVAGASDNAADCNANSIPHSQYYAVAVTQFSAFYVHFCPLYT